jgi:hypothetical protein
MVEQQQDMTTASTYDKRRIELKEIALEWRRRDEDRTLMLIEDKLSEELRKYDVQERAR